MMENPYVSVTQYSNAVGGHRFDLFLINPVGSESMGMHIIPGRRGASSLPGSLLPNGNAKGSHKLSTSSVEDDTKIGYNILWVIDLGRIYHIRVWGRINETQKDKSLHWYNQ